MITDEVVQKVLLCPMQENSAQAATVGEYLSLLLSTLWIQGEGFSGKRPFGESSWEYEVYTALATEELIDGLILDEDGYLDEFSADDRYAADELVLQTIQAMGKGPV